MGKNYIDNAIIKFTKEGMSRQDALVLLKNITASRMKGAEYNDRLYEKLLDDLDSIEQMLKEGEEC